MTTRARLAVLALTACLVVGAGLMRRYRLRHAPAAPLSGPIERHDLSDLVRLMGGALP